MYFVIYNQRNEYAIKVLKVNIKSYSNEMKWAFIQLFLVCHNVNPMHVFNILLSCNTMSCSCQFKWAQAVKLFSVPTQTLFWYKHMYFKK
jgi:hypothetical protein